MNKRLDSHFAETNNRIRMNSNLIFDTDREKETFHVERLPLQKISFKCSLSHPSFTLSSHSLCFGKQTMKLTLLMTQARGRQ